MPMTTRRTVLKQGAALGVALTAPGVLAQGANAQAAGNPLAIPPLLEPRAEGGRDVYDLAIAHGETEFYEGVKTRTMGINQSYLGPTVRLSAGHDVRFNVANNLNEETTLHWHGFHLPASADGGPHQVIKPGTVWSPEFRIRQKAGTFWYHSHQMGKTAEHVWAGLAGLMIVDDADNAPPGLPSTYGVDDIPVVLQDRWFTDDGQMPYAPNMHNVMMGMTGNVALANGTVNATLEATAGLLRLRLLNGSNATFYAMHFADEREFLQIATDGGLLERPHETNHVLLAPGERAEIVVDLSDGEVALLRAAPMNARGATLAEEVLHRTFRSENHPFTFLEIRASGSAPETSVPKTLALLPAVSAGDAVRTRRFELEMSGMGGMMGRRLGLSGGGPFSINGKSMDMGHVNEVVPMGETEIWEIVNTSPMAHPFHVHNTQFRILDRGGKPPHPGEAGLKDTVVAYPDEVVRILVTFDEYSDPDLPYMYHCHILEHEDAGMMGQFTVV